MSPRQPSEPPAPHGPGQPAPSDPQRELRETVGLLLSTQQSLIDLRERRDREQRVLDAIVRASERVLSHARLSSFWDSVVDAATEAFECEVCMAIEYEGNERRILASRGPRPTLLPEPEEGVRRLHDFLARNALFQEGPALKHLAFGGEELAAMMLAPVSAPGETPIRILLTAVTERKKAFFPAMDALGVPGLRMFASHVDVLHRMLLSHQLVADQLEQLDRTNRALERANATLEERVEEQQRTESLLRESEGRYRHLFEDSADGMALVDDHTGRLVDCNPALCRISARGCHDLFGMLLTDLLEAPGAATRERLEGDVRVLEQALRTPDGKSVPVEIRMMRMRAAGRDQQLCIFHDLSHRRQAEADQERLQSQLAQARRMESIGRLAGGVAHDFNNLLMVIFGNTEMLMGAPDLPEHMLAHLTEIEGASRRAQELTQQLLIFSRKQVIQPVPVDMNRTLEDSLRIYRRLLGEDITLHFRPCPEATPVLADRQQLDQLLGNLLLNARDAIHDAQPPVSVREIHVATRIVRVNSPLPNSEPAVQLTVRDTGGGMDEAMQANIFEPFFTTKEVNKGTGLGLATVLGVIQQNQGTIEVRSTPGAGATFIVSWPLRVETGIEDPSAPIPAVDDRDHVLLVEDDDQVRKLMVMGLRRVGFHVQEFDRGDRALDAIDSGRVRPDILVSDVVMPHMNGKQLADEVRRRMPSLPILFVSGYTDDIIAQHGIVGGGIALLSKPFSPATLGQRVRELLDARV